jgi:hypothetical protein
VDKKYTQFYKNETTSKILDNSAFEMYKQGRDMYDSDKLLDMAKKVDTKYIVMTDYPDAPPSKLLTQLRN